MSIPPLVCSTPPPPEQCEDDKDTEDFDLQYNLSQEDYEENYDYGNFATYNHVQSASSLSGNEAKPDTPVTINIIENEKQFVTTEENTNDIEIEVAINTTSERKLKLEEETNIEDLNLKIADETIESIVIQDNSVVESETNSYIAPTLNSSDQVIPNTTADLRQDDLNICTLPSEDLVVESTNLDHIQEPLAFADEIIEDGPDLQVNISENVTPFEGTKPETTTTEIELNIVADDDFGDFEDVMVVNDKKPTTIIDSCDNPWDSKEFGDNDFKADFEESINPISQQYTIEHSKEDSQSENQIANNETDDDDFGDFDDFKSSATDTEVNVFTEESVTCHEVPVLNLHSPDSENQVIEKVNKVLSTIFEHEIPEPDKEFEGNLDSMLGETWGYLLETDVRQPYMVNWNNSTGQKTLLKSLCIDSRNILFGPKWSYNMPKYAANLSVAPLQPQKQSTPPSAAQSESLNPDKTGTKAATTWSDPFTSDGQESCNTENERENAVTETGPTDLDVFEAAVSSKPDKIYSSTLNVQPLRQINLPDTHIFTPTDSETPRSKTIHYDSSPAVPLPQAVLETNKQSEKSTSQPSSSSSTVANNLGDENEYWEFQDFKGPSDTLSTTKQQTIENNESATSTKAPIPSVSYATQVLQPIKVEPIMPTLNWPDPGEVKETFDDFSDFVSNSTWSNEKPDVTVSSSQLESSKPVVDFKKADTIIVNETTANERVAYKNSNSFDDDFDTFQSALPSQSSLQIEFNHSNHDAVTKSASIPQQMSSQKIAEFSNAFPNIDTLKSDSISSVNTIKSNNVIEQNSTSLIRPPLDSTTNRTEVKRLPNPPSSIPFSSIILQPVPASSSMASHNQQKSAQILQPLSLESYSQINWPNPGIDLQDLSRFNPVETLQSLKSDLNVNSQSKIASPVHSQKTSGANQISDDDIWGEFVSSKPKQQQAMPKKSPAFVDDDEWTDFVSSPSVKPQNGLNTISLNVHTNLNSQKSSNQNKFTMKNNQPMDIPTLNYITPKSNTQKTYNDRQFQNL